MITHSFYCVDHNIIIVLGKYVQTMGNKMRTSRPSTFIIFQWSIGIFLIICLLAYSPSSYKMFFGFLMLVLFIIALFDEIAYFNKKFVSLLLTVSLVFILGVMFFQPDPSFNETDYLIVGISTVFVFVSVLLIIREWDKIEKAVGPYDKSLEVNPDDIKSWNNKGVELMNIRRFQWAMECFDKVLELEPDDSAALHNKGVILTKLSKHKKATEYFDRALEVDPGFENAKKRGEIILET